MEELLINDSYGIAKVMANSTVYCTLGAGWTTTTSPSFAVRLPLSSHTCVETLVRKQYGTKVH
jgi:hypothetical protein